MMKVIILSARLVNGFAGLFILAIGTLELFGLIPNSDEGAYEISKRLKFSIPPLIIGLTLLAPFQICSTGSLYRILLGLHGCSIISVVYFISSSMSASSVSPVISLTDPFVIIVIILLANIAALIYTNKNPDVIT
jgi:hypothetical protein